MDGALAINAETLTSPTGLLFALRDGINRCTCHVSTCDPCVCSPLAKDEGAGGLSGNSTAAGASSSIIDVSGIDGPTDSGSIFGLPSLFDLDIFGSDDDAADMEAGSVTSTGRTGGGGLSAAASSVLPLLLGILFVMASLLVYARAKRKRVRGSRQRMSVTGKDNFSNEMFEREVQADDVFDGSTDGGGSLHTTSLTMFASEKQPTSSHRASIFNPLFGDGVDDDLATATMPAKGALDFTGQHGEGEVNSHELGSMMSEALSVDEIVDEALGDTKLGAARKRRFSEIQEKRARTTHRVKGKGKSNKARR